MEVIPEMTLDEIIRQYPETEEVLLSFFEGGDYSLSSYSQTLEEVADLAGLDVDDILSEIAQVIDEEG